MGLSHLRICIQWLRRCPDKQPKPRNDLSSETDFFSAGFTATRRERTAQPAVLVKVAACQPDATGDEERSDFSGISLRPTKRQSSLSTVREPRFLRSPPAPVAKPRIPFNLLQRILRKQAAAPSGGTANNLSDQSRSSGSQKRKASAAPHSQCSDHAS